MGHQPRVAVIVVHDGPSADPDLVHTLEGAGVHVRFARSTAETFARIAEWPPDAVIAEPLDDRSTIVSDLAAALLADVRLIAIGDPRTIAQPGSANVPECVLFTQPDEPTVRGVLSAPPPISADVLLRELVSVSVFGQDLPTTLEQLAVRLATAFGADDCIVLLPEESRGYSARQIPDELMASLARLAETVCRCATTVIAPARPGRPYRAFLGMPLSHNNGPPLALVLLCRESPIPFGHSALAYLRGLVVGSRRICRGASSTSVCSPTATSSASCRASTPCSASRTGPRSSKSCRAGSPRPNIAVSRSAWRSSTSTGSG